MLKVVSLLMLCYIVIDVHADEQEVMKKAHEQCTAETGVKDSHISDTMKGIFDPARKVQNYYRCLGTLLGLIDGYTLDEEALLDLVPPEKKDYVQKVINQCKPGISTTDDEFLEIIYNRLVCSYQVSPTEYWLA